MPIPQTREEKEENDTLRIALKCHISLSFFTKEIGNTHNLRNGPPIGKTNSSKAVAILLF